jgi:hypothetical protein
MTLHCLRLTQSAVDTLFIICRLYREYAMLRGVCMFWLPILSNLRSSSLFPHIPHLTCCACLLSRTFGLSSKLSHVCMGCLVVLLCGFEGKCLGGSCAQGKCAKVACRDLMRRENCEQIGCYGLVLTENSGQINCCDACVWVFRCHVELDPAAMGLLGWGMDGSVYRYAVFIP